MAKVLSTKPEALSLMFLKLTLRKERTNLRKFFSDPYTWVFVLMCTQTHTHTIHTIRGENIA